MAKTTTEMLTTWDIFINKLINFEASQFEFLNKTPPSETTTRQELLDFLTKNSSPPVEMEICPQLCIFDSDFPDNMRHPELCSLINEFLNHCTTLSKNPKTCAEIKFLCKLLVDFQLLNAYLLGWEHFSAFSANIEEYQAKKGFIGRSATPRAATATDPQPQRGSTAAYIAFGHLISPELKAVVRKGEEILQAFLQRIDTVLKIRYESFPEATRPSSNVTLDALLRVFKADTVFLDKIQQFKKEAEAVINPMVKSNGGRTLTLFTNEEKRGVRWPHSAQMRLKIEEAGFKFEPMMFKRDRCVCVTCDAEVSGWRPWHDPWSFHKMEKHPHGIQHALYNRPSDIKHYQERIAKLAAMEGAAKLFVDPRPLSRHQFGDSSIVVFSAAGNNAEASKKAAAAVTNPPIAMPIPTPMPTTPTPTPRPA